MRIHLPALATAALLVSTPLAAQETSTAAPATPATPRLRAIARMGLEAGGDKVLEFQYDDGTTPDVTAGGGLSLAFGAAYRALPFGPGGFDLQATAGLKYRTIPPASNQSASWARYPVEAMVLYRTRRGFGIGAGATAHLGNSLSMDGEAANASVKFGAAPGAMVQAEWMFGGIVLDARYTAIAYRVTGSDESVDASNVGLGVGFLFGGRGSR